MRLKGKRILVTGASSGIGRETAVILVREGARVVLVGRNSDKLNETALLTGSDQTESICLDLSDESSFQIAFSEMSPIDGIVHCAGIVDPYPIAYLNREKLMKTFGINFIAPALLTSFLLRSKKFNKEVSMVFISSISVEYPYEGGSMYSSSKGALEAFARTCALELVTKKIRANIIAPALIRTPMVDEAEKNMVNSSMEEILKKRYPLGMGTPSDVGNLVVFLLSNESRWITGKKFTIDGGVLLSSAL